MDEWQLIAQDAHFSWMQGEALETLRNCFDPKTEEIPAGESGESGGRLGYLLEGCAMLNGEKLSAGSLVGICAGGSRGYARSDDRITAVSACKVLWFPWDALEFACYRGCWFHARFLREIQIILGNEP